MGFWGSLVLCQSNAELGEIEAIVSRDESVTEIARPGGAWRIGQGEDIALIDDAAAFLGELVAECGAPALLGYVLDSDCVDVVALGTQSGLWRSCLDRTAMQAYADGEPLDASILLPAPAAERAAQWALEAGLQPNLPALRNVFSSSGDELFAEALFFELVDALGTAKAPAPTQPQPAEPSSRSSKASSNPLDAFVRDYAADLLKSAGFTKRGRMFRRANHRGDVAVVQFRSFTLGNLVDLHLLSGVSPRPVADFAAEFLGGRQASPDAGDAAWQCEWPAPKRADEQWPIGTWSVRDASEREPLGHTLARTLSEEVLPTLAALLDRATFVEVVQNRGLLRGRTMMGAGDIAVVLLADEGPTVALDLAMRALDSHPVEPAALAWARRRLAERGYPDDGWRDGVWRVDSDPHVRLAALLEAEVDAHMTAEGFTRTGTRYQLVSEVGDYALVEFTPIIGLTDSAVRFRVSSAVLPGPELEWRRARAAARPDTAWAAIEPEARTGWLQSRHLPPSTHAVIDGPLPNLNASLWAFTPATAAACSVAIVRLLTSEVVPRLRHLLNRKELLATVLGAETDADVGKAHATIILLVDEGPSDRLEAMLQHEELYEYGPTEPELAAWARTRLSEEPNGS